LPKAKTQILNRIESFKNQNVIVGRVGNP